MLTQSAYTQSPPEVQYVKATEYLVVNALNISSPAYDKICISRDAVQAPVYKRVDTRRPDAVTTTLDIDAITTEDRRPFGTWTCIEDHLCQPLPFDEEPITITKETRRQMCGHLHDNELILRPARCDPLELTVTTPVSEILVEYYPNGEVYISLAFAFPALVEDSENDAVPSYPTPAPVMRMKRTRLDDSQLRVLRRVVLKQWETFRTAQPSDGECHDSLPVRLLPSDAFSGSTLFV